MRTTIPFFISARGGSITCFRGDSGRIFRSCSRTECVYSSDLHSAKALLDNLESKKNLLAGDTTKFTTHPKTTLKWNNDGELSAVDMTRILDRLANPKLTQCDLACLRNCHEDYNTDASSKHRYTQFDKEVPTSSWLP